MALTCSRCGAKQGFMAALSVDLADGTYTCPDCVTAIEREKHEKLKQLREAASKIVVTTTNNIDGYFVKKYVGIESVEFVIGTGVFSEVSGEFRDFFGLRSTAFEKKLQAAKESAFEALKMIAAEKGANAIIGIDIDYTEFSGNRIGLIINGTLVQVVPIRQATDGLAREVPTTTGSAPRRA